MSPKTLEMYFTKAKPNWVIIPENVSEWWKPYSVREKEKKEAARAGGKGRNSVGLRGARARTRRERRTFDMCHILSILRACVRAWALSVFVF